MIATFNRQPIGSLRAAYVLGEQRGMESVAPMLIGDHIPPLHEELLRVTFGEVNDAMVAAYRDGHHNGRKQTGAAT